MKIHNVSIFFMMGVLLQTHLAFPMDGFYEIATPNQNVEKEKKKSEQDVQECSEGSISNRLVTFVAKNFSPFVHKEEVFDAFIIQVNPHDELNKFTLATLFAYEGHYSGEPRIPSDLIETAVVPFAEIAKKMKTASHLKVYKGKDQVYLSMRSDAQNREAIVAVISLNDKSPKKANL